MSTAKLAGSESGKDERMELTCSALECGGASLENCLSKKISCQRLTLFRIIHIGQSEQFTSVAIVNNVGVKEEWDERLTAFKVTEASNSRLVVEMPRSKCLDLTLTISRYFSHLKYKNKA